MRDVVVAILSVLGGYLLGTLPTAAAVGRRAGHDPLTEGSGNPGATNVYRTAGRRAGALVLLGDLCKGALAAGAGWLLGDHLLGVACGAAAVAGHVFPVGLGRRGGKGVATCGGFVLVAYPLVGLGGALLWAAAAKLSRRASVASLVIAVAIPAGVAALGAPAAEVAIVAGVAVVVVGRHASNIARLARGTERPVEAGRS
jgi:acyl phosphate:glycerol-3-phosphate acyltransferase